ncbi:MAG TPA: ferritin-like domain-containing protein [Burkholderiales bacterium]|jgi:bacterioferritin
MSEVDKKAALDVLNRILELEMAGVVRYAHYSLMVYGYNRIPIVGWLREQGLESLAHAHRAGELITALGGHPSLAIGPLLETHKHDIGDILRESLAHERQGLDAYLALHKLAQNKSVLLEEYTREMIAKEEMHLAEVDKMLRRPGDIGPYASSAAE